jgi:hypothetical protein
MPLTTTPSQPVNYNINEIIEEMSEESSFHYNQSPECRKIVKKKGGGKSLLTPVKLPVKPLLLQLLKDVLNSDFLYFLSDFLTTGEIIKLQGVSKLFKNSLRIYLPTRLE